MASRKEVKRSDITTSSIRDSLKRMSAFNITQSMVDKISLKSVNFEAMTLAKEPRIDFFYTEEMIYYMADLLLLRG